MKKILLSLMAMLFMCGVSSCSENHEYVDLGLPSGTLWATCNVGATKPTEYGDLFAWGEASSKKTFTSENYKFYKNEKGEITNYNTKSEYGTVDNKKVLETQDDAAAVNWGGSWRMPTLEEMKELVSCCDWEWTDSYEGSGVTGRIGKSKYNGNVIFLPAAGYGNANGRVHVGRDGSYWSRSLYSSSPGSAYDLVFNSGGICVSDYDYRDNGCSVRAVCPSKKCSEPTVSGNVSGYDYVDLGLPSGNLWATMNIGADKIEAYGDLYSWGETSPKDNYGEDYYSLYKKDATEVDGFTNYINGYTKYVPKDKASEYGYGGFFDNKTTLDLADDVAHVKLGGSWRMPTKKDFDELLEKCENVWCTYQGVNGYKFTAKNGKWLFLPAAGYSFDSRRIGNFGCYWSSSLDSYYPYDAYYLYFGSGDVGDDSGWRYCGYSVRAVCPTR